MTKVFVEVVAKYDAQGHIVPCEIVWEDGRRYTIERIIDVRPAASLKVGGAGTRYRVRIGRRETFIFLEENRWFVEAVH